MRGVSLLPMNQLLRFTHLVLVLCLVSRVASAQACPTDTSLAGRFASVEWVVTASLREAKRVVGQGDRHVRYRLESVASWKATFGDASATSVSASLPEDGGPPIPQPGRYLL